MGTPRRREWKNPNLEALRLQHALDGGQTLDKKAAVVAAAPLLLLKPPLPESKPDPQEKKAILNDWAKSVCGSVLEQLVYVRHKDGSEEWSLPLHKKAALLPPLYATPDPEETRRAQEVGYGCALEVKKKQETGVPLNLEMKPDPDYQKVGAESWHSLFYQQVRLQQERDARAEAGEARRHYEQQRQRREKRAQRAMTQKTKSSTPTTTTPRKPRSFFESSKKKP